MRLNEAERLIVERKRKKLSQGELARQIGSYQTRISRLENAQNEPTEQEKRRIEQVLNTLIWSAVTTPQDKLLQDRVFSDHS